MNTNIRLVLLFAVTFPFCSSSKADPGYGSDRQGRIASFDSYGSTTNGPVIDTGGPSGDIAISSRIDSGGFPESVTAWMASSGSVVGYDLASGTWIGSPLNVGAYWHSIAVTGPWVAWADPDAALLWGSDGAGQVQAFALGDGSPWGSPLSVGVFSQAIAIGQTARYGGTYDLALWGSDGNGNVQAFDLLTGQTIGASIDVGAFSEDIAFDENGFLWGSDGSRIARFNDAVAGPSVTAQLGIYGAAIDFPRYFIPEPSTYALIACGIVVWLVCFRRRLFLSSNQPPRVG